MFGLWGATTARAALPESFVLTATHATSASAAAIEGTSLSFTNPPSWLNHDRVIALRRVRPVRAREGFCKARLRGERLFGRLGLFFDEGNCSRAEPDEKRHRETSDACDGEREFRATRGGEPAGHDPAQRARAREGEEIDPDQAAAEMIGRGELDEG